MRPLTTIIIAYLLGSIPFGYLIVRLASGGDVRTTGSGGTGATNVSRRAGKLAGVITLALDAGKGALTVVLAKMLLLAPVYPAPAAATSHILPGPTTSDLQQAYWWVAAAAVTAIVGHIFPVWLKFRGGKGVATGLGIFSILAPLAVALSVVLFFVIVVLTRYVSLASLGATISIPLFIFLGSFVRPVSGTVPTLAAAVFCAGLIVFAHRENIRRLASGTESKFK